MVNEFIEGLRIDDVFLGIKGKNKKSIISSILDHLSDIKKIDKKDKRSILKAVIQREEMGSTAIGGHIALPHARLKCIKKIIICVAVSKEGVDFDALDDEPVYVIVLLLSNQQEAGVHLKTLAHLAKLLRDRSFVQKLRDAKSREEIIDLIIRQHNLLK